MLLMERSVERYPYITTILMEYLKFTIDEYHPPIRDHIAQCVAFGMKELIRVGVIRFVFSFFIWYPCYDRHANSWKLKNTVTNPPQMLIGC